MRFVAMAVTLCLFLAGCGGTGKAEKGSPKSSATTVATSTPTALPTPLSSPTGVPAPDALTNFLCAADDKGTWSASGILTNDSKKPVTYQVTVLVGQANGQQTQALTKQYASISSNGSVKIALSPIPAAQGATQCHVQVLAK